jgi:hypothetical protein
LRGSCSETQLGALEKAKADSRRIEVGLQLFDAGRLGETRDCGRELKIRRARPADFDNLLRLIEALL